MLDMQSLTLPEVEAVEIAVMGGGMQARHYRPAGHPRAVVVIHGATGVPQGFYRAFAQWMVEVRGFAVLAYDYRDFGSSAQGPVRASRLRMSDWGLKDQQAARDWLAARWPGVPLWVIGHSLGGLMMPMQEGLGGVDRMIGVASGRANIAAHPWPYRGLAALFWYGHGPALVAALGYLPAKLSGLGGADLPAPVYWQWRKWCTSRDFYFTDPVMPEPNWPGDVPVTLWAAEDDEICPPSCVEALASVYGDGARVRRINPRDYGLRGIGHMGVFARRNAVLWPEIVPES